METFMDKKAVYALTKTAFELLRKSQTPVAAVERDASTKIDAIEVPLDSSAEKVSDKDAGSAVAAVVPKEKLYQSGRRQRVTNFGKVGAAAAEKLAKENEKLAKEHEKNEKAMSVAQRKRDRAEEKAKKRVRKSPKAKKGKFFPINSIFQINCWKSLIVQKTVNLKRSKARKMRWSSQPPE